MNIKFLPPGLIGNIKKIEFASNPIVGFKGQLPDTFEKRDYSKYTPHQQAVAIKNSDDKIKAQNQRIIELEQQRYSDEIYKARLSAKDELREMLAQRQKLIAQFNPNVAFMRTEAPWGSTRDTLEQKREIIPMQELPKYNDCAFKALWNNPNYFVLNKLTIGKFLDSSYELNKENYEKLANKDAMSFAEFSRKFGMDIKDLNRYVKEGFLETETLKNYLTEEDVPVRILTYENNETNLNGVARYNKVRTALVKSPYFDKQYLPAKYLARLGFGTEEELELAVRNKNLTGKIMPVKTKNGIRNELFIAHKGAKAEGELRFLRNNNKNIVDCEEFIKLARIDLTELEDEILDGEVKIIDNYIFDKDKGKILINLKNPQNVEFMEKKNFEHEMIRHERYKNASIKLKIAWALSKNTQKIKDEIISLHPELTEIFKKKDKIKDYLERKEKGLLEEDEKEPVLTRNDRIKIKCFFKSVWEQAGVEEYKESVARAKQGLAEYKKGGIDLVSDKEVKELLMEIMQEQTL